MLGVTCWVDTGTAGSPSEEAFVTSGAPTLWLGDGTTAWLVAGYGLLNCYELTFWGGEHVAVAIAQERRYMRRHSPHRRHSARLPARQWLGPYLDLYVCMYRQIKQQNK